ncbi:MAG TPA: cupin domain-containing protein, partial [Rhizomicrobium sp.]|nr:cupin domain-containing protein [Rhizomicrobium sp.]
MNADTLSEVLKAVRLKGAVFFDVEASDPWVAEALPARTIASAILPESEHVMEYHVVTSGSCWASVIGRDLAPVRLQAGDVVAFPQGDAHILSSAPGMRGDPGPVADMLSSANTSLP